MVELVQPYRKATVSPKNKNISRITSLNTQLLYLEADGLQHTSCLSCQLRTGK